MDNLKQFLQFSVVRSTLVVLAGCGSVTSDPAAIHDPHSVAYWPRSAEQPKKKNDTESVFNAAAQGSALAPSWWLLCSTTPIPCEMPSGISWMIKVQPLAACRRSEIS